MADKTIRELEDTIRPNDDAYMPVYESGSTKKITFTSLADNLWEQMYVKARVVICVCSWCGAGNAITNPTCCQCGGAIGKEAIGEK